MIIYIYNRHLCNVFCIDFIDIDNVDPYQFRCVQKKIYKVMDLYEIFLRIPDIRDIIFSYLDKYQDNLYVFRKLSKSFYYIHLYDHLRITKLNTNNKYSNQPKKFIKNFLQSNKIKSLYISDFNKKLLQMDFFFLKKTCD